MQIEAHQDAPAIIPAWIHKSIMQITLDASNRFSFSANELDYHVTTPRPFPRREIGARSRRSESRAFAAAAPPIPATRLTEQIKCRVADLNCQRDALCDAYFAL
jgi:hypothetical protein